MRQIRRNTLRRISFCLGLCSLMLLTLSACVHQPSQDSAAQVDYGSAPTLSGLRASPNPSESGRVIQLTTSYVDPDSDFTSGIAAISIDGENPTSTAFRATYPSGVLNLPFVISAYARPSNIRISLKIRDDAGNWSNAVSTTLLIRESSVNTPLPIKEEGL